MRRRGVCAASDGRVADPRRRRRGAARRSSSRSVDLRGSTADRGRRGAALRTLAGVFGLTPSAERRAARRRTATTTTACGLTSAYFAYWIDAGQRTRVIEPVVAWRREHLPAERSVFKRIARANVSGEMARCALHRPRPPPSSSLWMNTPPSATKACRWAVRVEASLVLCLRSVTPNFRMSRRPRSESNSERARARVEQREWPHLAGSVRAAGEHHNDEQMAMYER
jgi:hypothetical protein